jgi:hypothetical protein
MTPLSRLLSLLLASSALVACGRHAPDPHQVAAAGAEAFARQAVVERDFAKAYAMLPEGERRLTPLDVFTEGIRSQHPRGFPTTVRATEYELKPEGVLVYLVGEGTAESFLYRIPMVSRGQTAYFPVGFVRDDPAQPHSPARQRLRTTASH